MLNDLKKTYYLANTTATSGQVNDLELQWLQANGATSAVLMDAWAEYFDAQSVPTGHHNVRKALWLQSQGFVGPLADMELEFYADLGTWVAQLDGALRYWQFDVPINLVGDFEIQLGAYMVDDGVNGIISSELDFTGFGAYHQLSSGRLIEGYYKTNSGVAKQTLLTNTVPNGKIPAYRQLRFVKSGNVLTLHADGGQKVISDAEMSATQIVSRIGRNGGLYSGGYYDNFKVFTGGDATTGVLTHEIPLTNKSQGATQLATVGNVNATMVGYTEDVWEKI